MRLSRVSWPHLALLAVTIHFLLGALFGLSRHWAYLTSINDLGIFDQAVWGILNGAPFVNTNNPFGIPINWLGFHFNPILLGAAPFYWIYPAAEWLIILQAAAISISAWPLYLLARDVTQSERTACLWVVAYLANPFVLNAAAWDFHPVSLAAPVMALSVLAIEKRQAWLLMLGCLTLLLIQEQFGMAVAGFGVLWWLRNKTLTPAAVVSCLGLAHSVLVLGVIMPALSPTGSHVMMSSSLGQLSRYGWLGGSESEIVWNAFSHPLVLLRTAFVDFHGWIYLVLLLVPFLTFPLAGVEFLIPGMADFAANLLSANPMPRSVFAYHSISLIPLLVAGGIYGSSRIAAKLEWSTAEMAKRVLLVSLVLGYLLAPLPLPYARNFWQPTSWPLVPDKAVVQISELLPAEISISVQGNVGAHFSERHRVYPFPTKVGEVDAVVLRLASPTKRAADESSAKIGSLGQHLLMPPARYLDTVENLLNEDGYGVAYWQPPWLVLSKNADKGLAVRRTISQYLEGLRKEWNVGESIISAQPK